MGQKGMAFYNIIFDDGKPMGEFGPISGNRAIKTNPRESEAAKVQD